MAEINEIIAKEAIEGIKLADRYISDFDKSILKLIDNTKQLNNALSGQTTTIKDVNDAVKKTAQSAKQLTDARTKQTQAEKEAERTAKKLADQQAKLAAKEKERADNLKITVKSISDAEKQNKALRETLKTLDLTTKQGQETLKKYNSQINQNTEFIRKNSDAAKQQSMNVGNYGSVWDKAKIAMAGAGAAMGLLGGAIAFSKGIIESTGATAREFKAITTGMSWAWDEFKKALATSDFSNLLTNMSNAIDAGRQYVNMLADVKRSTRALNITNSELNIEFQKQKVLERDVSKSKEERIAAGKKALEIEEKMTKDQLMVTEKAFNAEMLHLRTITKLKDDDIKAAISTYNTNKKNLDLANQYNKAVSEAKAAASSGNASALYGQTTGSTISKETKAIIANSSPEIIKLANIMKAMGKTTGDELDKVAEKWVEYNNIQAESVTKTARVKITLGRLEKGIIDDGIKEQEKQTKEAEKAKNAVEKLTEKIQKLKEQLSVSLLTTGQAPDGLMRQIIGSEAELNRVKEQVDSIVNGLQKVASKGYQTKYDPFTGQRTIQDIATGGANTGILTPRTATGGTAAAGAAGTNTLFTSEESRNLAIEGAQTTSDAIFSIIANADQAAFDHKMSLLEKEKEAKLKNSKLTEKQREKIEADYAKKSAKLKEEQFRKEKAASIIQAIINTALAVTKAAPNVANMVAAGIAGAASIAVISAQPVPQFDAGSLNTPDTFIAGERRPEWMITKEGSVSLISRPTMFKNMAGATVIGGAETERLMQSGITPAIDIRPDIRAMKDELKEAIRNKREISISASGSKITEREGAHYKEYFNKSAQWIGKKN